MLISTATLRQHLDDPPGANPPGDVDRQAFPGELIDDRHAFQAAAVGAQGSDMLQMAGLQGVTLDDETHGVLLMNSRPQLYTRAAATALARR